MMICYDLLYCMVVSIFFSLFGIIRHLFHALGVRFNTWTFITTTAGLCISGVILQDRVDVFLQFGILSRKKKHTSLIYTKKKKVMYFFFPLLVFLLYLLFFGA